jgi:hypothetical protein
MASWAISLRTAGVVLVNLMLLSIRFFARSQGLKVSWWNRRYAAERKHLRSLARSDDPSLAKRARWYLQLEVLAWILFVLSATSFFWGIASR